MIKVRKWFMWLLRLTLIPMLEKVHGAVHKHAESTPEEWDDILCGAFETVIEFLKDPDTFEET